MEQTLVKLGQIEDDDFDAPVERGKEVHVAKKPSVSQEAMDFLRHEFLNDLDLSMKVSVSDWEASFIDSNMRRKSFSLKQREIIDKMRKKYEDKL